MSQEKLSITKQELHSKHVEEILEKQAALSGEVEFLYGKDKPKVKGSIFLSSWFYLFLAGLLGAFMSWLIIEPNFDDFIRISGQIEEVRETFPITGANELVHYVKIDGKGILFLEQSIYDGIDENGKKITKFSDLSVGQYAYVVCENVYEENGLGAAIKIGPSPFPEFNKGRSLSVISIQKTLWSLIIFIILGALIALFVGCADGIIGRNYKKAIIAGVIGMFIGILGGLISTFVGGLVYAILGIFTSTTLNPFESAIGFIAQVVRRTFAWAILGMTMGLGQGIALRSRKMILNGFLGGMLGALLGGLLFDPIDILILSKGVLDPFRSADISRLVGFCLTGAFVGLMIGIVEQINKDAWLIMTKGPISGKQFIIYKDITRIGSSPNCEIYLFKDSDVLPEHAIIQKIHDGYLLKDNSSAVGTQVNNRKIREHKLRNGDKVDIGNTSFTFAEKERKIKK
ncbi:MAG TPA: MFS transporter [Candidatus Eremiobacteraeota bacterium]|nr:MAG: Glycogen accumulation regulator GarA [bacterium ADurb.Bin363]HPZ07966.1 MFS transporter [Candidatus Eremiobacteraeota bacterium]